MSEQNNQEQPQAWGSTYKAVMIGFSRDMVGFLFEYPLECIKSRLQVAGNAGMRQVMIDTYRQYGFRGYYHGATASLIKKAPVQLFRWPMILQLPPYFSDALKMTPFVGKENKYWNIAAGNFAAAMTLATTETVLLTPFEACRLDLVVNKQYTSSVLNYMKESSFRHHYVGLDAQFFKECAGWTTFLLGCNLLRSVARAYNNGESIKPYQLIGISAVVSAANTATLLPWDVTRTHIQRQSKTHGLGSVDFAFYTMRDIAKREGARSLWRGSGIRFFQVFKGALLTVPALEYFDKSNAGPG